MCGCVCNMKLRVVVNFQGFAQYNLSDGYALGKIA